MSDTTIPSPGEPRVETFDAQAVHASSLYNEDLAPVPAARRTWGTYNYAALWIAMSVNIPTYLLASAMIAGGMSWKQAIFTVFLGNVLVLIPMLLERARGRGVRNSLPGFRAFRLRSAGCERARDAAGAGGVRLVRNPDLDRRRSDQRDDRGARARLEKRHVGRAGLLPVFLAAESSW